MQIIQKFGESYEETQNITEITKFNSNFTKFEERYDITAQEIVTLHNFIDEYKNKNGTTISLFVTGGINGDAQSFIQKNADKKFQCKTGDIEYNPGTGRISSIRFR